MQPEIIVPRSDDQRRHVGEICALAFNAPIETSMRYGEATGWDIYRLAMVDGRPAACLGVHDFGQWFGGRVIPCAGVAAVASALAFRGRGVVKQLMVECLREQRGAGKLISTLFAATRGLYRKVGYETAGSHFELELAPRDIDLCCRVGEVRPVTPADRPILESIYDRRAALTPGFLKRNDFEWNVLFAMPSGEKRDGVLVTIDGEPQGYMMWLRGPTVNGWHSMAIRDFIALTPQAGARLWTLIADHRTQVDRAVWRGSPSDPLLLLLGEHPYKARLKDHWMVRLLDVPAALTARGYSAGLSGEAVIEVHGDDIFPDSNGRFAVRVSAGRAHVTSVTQEVGDAATSRKSVRIHIRGLAALSTGHASAEDLMLAGLAQGQPEALAGLSSIFHGPEPWMPDYF